MVAVLELILATVHTTTSAHHAVAHHALVHSCIWVSVYSGFYVILSGGGGQAGGGCPPIANSYLT